MSDRPAYRQVADELRRRIADGVYGPGALLPSESGLIEEFAISRTTARQAFAVLRGEGLVDAIVGRGVYVRERRPRHRRPSDAYLPPADRAGETRSTYEVDDPPAEKASVRTLPAEAEVARRLAVAEGEPVLERRWRSTSGSEPPVWSVSWVPARLIQDAPASDEREPEPSGTLALLAAAGVRVTEVTEDVVVRAPTPQETEQLRLRTGESVIEVARTMLAGDQPVETADIVLAGDRYLLSYRIPLP